MSMYAMMGGGQSPMVPMLAVVLSQAGPLNPPRFRDAWLANDGKTIVVLTRTGGGNREDYAAENTAMTQHPLYRSDRDDEFDSTFAEWHFETPAHLVQYTETIFRLYYGGTSPSVTKVTDAALAALRGATEPKQSLSAEDIAALKDALAGFYEAVVGPEQDA